MKKFIIIGGDKRNLFLFDLLKQDFDIDITGFDNINYDLIQKADIVICPTPFAKDFYLNTPTLKSKITIQEFLSYLNKNQIIFAGAVQNDHNTLANKLGLKIIDLIKIEELAVLNAIPTSEGAILNAISLTDITIHNSNTLILGFGRIAKILAKSLFAMGAIVTVATNVHSEKATIFSYGYNHNFITELDKNLNKYDFIFNTIPFPYLDKNLLGFVNKNCIILDLASKPFGVDYEEAIRQNIKAVKLPGLSGIVAPKTAAVYIKNTILNVLGEMVVI